MMTKQWNEAPCTSTPNTNIHRMGNPTTLPSQHQVCFTYLTSTNILWQPLWLGWTLWPWEQAISQQESLQFTKEAKLRRWCCRLCFRTPFAIKVLFFGELAASCKRPRLNHWSTKLVPLLHNIHIYSLIIMFHDISWHTWMLHFSGWWYLDESNHTFTRTHGRGHLGGALVIAGLSASLAIWKRTPVTGDPMPPWLPEMRLCNLYICGTRLEAFDSYLLWIVINSFKDMGAKCAAIPLWILLDLCRMSA